MGARKMDVLAMEAMLAKQAGMSYGRWKAMQEPQEPKEKELPDGWLKCERCGQPFKKKAGKRFCDLDCRMKAYEAQLKIKNAERYRRSKQKFDK